MPYYQKYNWIDSTTGLIRQNKCILPPKIDFIGKRQDVALSSSSLANHLTI